jgi:hypothetical protein
LLRCGLKFANYGQNLFQGFKNSHLIILLSLYNNDPSLYSA